AIFANPAPSKPFRGWEEGGIPTFPNKRRPTSRVSVVPIDAQKEYLQPKSTGKKRRAVKREGSSQKPAAGSRLREAARPCRISNARCSINITAFIRRDHGNSHPRYPAGYRQQQSD